jgi:uncharacterized protein involved in outer membrane biogenesis
MKKILGLFSVFLLFLLVVLIGLALMPPTGLAKRLLVGGTKQASGLDLVINGPMWLQLVPSVNLSMENVVVTNPADPGRPVVTARKVDVTSSYASVLGGTRTIERVVLADPVIELDTDRQGRHSWIAAPEGAGSRSPGTSGAPAQAVAQRSFAIGRVELAGGTVAYRDQRSGLTARLERAQGELRGVTAERIGEARINAGAAVFREPGSGTELDASGLNLTGSGVDAARFASLSAVAERVRWRDRQQPSGIEATKFTASAQALGLDGAGPVTLRSEGLGWRDAAGVGTLAVTGLDVSAKGLRGGRLAEVAFKGGTLAYSHPAAGKLDLGSLSGTARSAGAELLEGLTIESGTLVYGHPGGSRFDAAKVVLGARSAQAEGIDDISFRSGPAAFSMSDGRKLDAGDLTAKLQRLTPARIEGAALESGRVAWVQSVRADTRGNVPSPELQQVSIASPVLAFGAPVEATVAFVHAKERVAGTVRLPTPEALMVEPAVPTVVSLEASRGKLDFDGRIDSGTGAVRGRTRAITPAVDQLAGWLGVALPATLKGSADLQGDVEVLGSRVALSNGRVQHGGNALTGTFAVDLGGERPKLSGRIASDRIAADAYLGVEPPKKPAPGTRRTVIKPEVGFNEVVKAQLRAMLEAPPTRGGPMALPEVSTDKIAPTRAKPTPQVSWSNDRIDLSALSAVDLDVDWAVKQLEVRGMTLGVPQLKTVLAGGALTIDGQGIATGDGRISGRAEIDVRPAVPRVAATVKAEGVDLEALSEVIGVTPLVSGATAVEADVRSAGVSQRQLVEGLSGKVRTRMGQGHVIGYDLGNIGLGTIWRWLTGDREYDPDLRTPISRLDANLDIDKGVVKESLVQVDGPVLGVDAQGTIRLVDQRLDITGRARIASFFSSLRFKLFGDWSAPTFAPDLDIASVFTRSGPGQPGLDELLSHVDMADPELALLIGRVMQRAGSTGLDAETSAFLQALQKRAMSPR